jgi:glycerol-3-phosphate acyltransferase PlsY
VLRYLALAYLVGSIPNAYLFTRWFTGQDIRRLGSENAGATNVTVNVGWFPGVLTLVADMGKGYLSALIGELSPFPLMPFLMPACAVAGHNWPVWLRFHGGGGLATFAGGCLALTGWLWPLAGIVFWGLAHLFCRDHDRSAALACILLPCAVLATQQSLETVTLVASSSFMILLRRLQSIRERARRWQPQGHRCSVG